ncbi:MAG: hypothetical protein KAQ83_02085 [Nanoarchaeota archaeon]|nr:hypothetical protein [Nanoarchaeota archaeon]
MENQTTGNQLYDLIMDDMEEAKTDELHVARGILESRLGDVNTEEFEALEDTQNSSIDVSTAQNLIDSEEGQSFYFTQFLCQNEKEYWYNGSEFEVTHSRGGLQNILGIPIKVYKDIRDNLLESNEGGIYHILSQHNIIGNSVHKIIKGDDFEEVFKSYCNQIYENTTGLKNRSIEGKYTLAAIAKIEPDEDGEIWIDTSREIDPIMFGNPRYGNLMVQTANSSKGLIVECYDGR